MQNATACSGRSAQLVAAPGGTGRMAGDSARPGSRGCTWRRSSGKTKGLWAFVKAD